MAAIIEIDYFNSYWVKRVATGPLTQDLDVLAPNPTTTNTNGTFTWPGPFGYGDAETSDNLPTTAAPYSVAEGSPPLVKQNWFAEESRIRGGYNNVQTDLGVKAYINEENPLQQFRENALIYSGSFNSATNFNETNVFSTSESITKALDPINGSIQRLYAEDTNLIVFQENKVSRALIDKDAIYSAEGGGSVTSSNLVIGQFVPYVGDYGISKNPESFAVYGFRKYFTDRYRNAVMRLSRDGLTEISNYGMVDWFRDELTKIGDDNFEASTSVILQASDQLNLKQVEIAYNPGIRTGSIVQYSNNNGNTYTSESIVSKIEFPLNINGVPITNRLKLTFRDDISTINNQDLLRFLYIDKARLVGGWDIYTKQYHLSLQKSNPVDQSLESYYTLGFDESVLGWTSFFTYKPNFIDSLKNRFYSVVNNDLYEHNYEAQNNRNVFYGVSNTPSVTFVFNPQPDLSKNFLTVNYEGSSGWSVVSFISDKQEPVSRYELDTNNNYVPIYTAGSFGIYEDSTQKVLSYIEGQYDSTVPPLYGTAAILRPFNYAGFKPKENLYVANLVSSSQPRAGEVLFNTNPNRAYPMSGIKANYATVTMAADLTTDLNGMKELFAVSTTYSRSGF